MARFNLLKLHWRLFFPLVGLLWLIIVITIVYFVSHEKQRQRENLENRLLNVGNTVNDAYERDENLKETVDFIRLFTDNTTLAPLRITVFDNNGRLLADNSAATIPAFDAAGRLNPEFAPLLNEGNASAVREIRLDGEKSMICLKKSLDGKMYAFAALPYEGEVVSFLSFNPMVWMVIILLGVILSVVAYFGVRAVCRNVYSLQDFAEAVASNRLPDDIDSWRFSRDELGEVSRKILTLYKERIQAQQEKILHERQIGMNVSHELKTPVGIIKGYLDTVLGSDDMSDEMRHKFLVRAQENTNRLTQLINDLSMVMRLQDNMNVSDVKEINIFKLAGQIKEDTSHGNITGDMTFDYNIPESCRITGHESLLTNAILNLIYNSACHSGGTQMSLNWVGTENGKHIFTFADDGMGVGEEHLSRLFDLFYRVDSGRARKNGGSGLGLPLVRKIINAMGGEITVENSRDGGLKFTFTLPVAQ